MSERMWRRPYQVELGYRCDPDIGGYHLQHDTFTNMESALEWVSHFFNGSLVFHDTDLDYILLLERNAKGEWETIEEYML